MVRSKRLTRVRSCAVGESSDLVNPLFVMMGYVTAGTVGDTLKIKRKEPPSKTNGEVGLEEKKSVSGVTAKSAPETPQLKPSSPDPATTKVGPEPEVSKPSADVGALKSDAEAPAAKSVALASSVERQVGADAGATKSDAEVSPAKSTDSRLAEETAVAKPGDETVSTKPGGETATATPVESATSSPKDETDGHANEAVKSVAEADEAVPGAGEDANSDAKLDSETGGGDNLQTGPVVNPTKDMA